MKINPLDFPYLENKGGFISNVSKNTTSLLNGRAAENFWGHTLEINPPLIFPTFRTRGGLFSRNSIDQKLTVLKIN